MLENYLFEAESRDQYATVILVSFCFTFLLALVNIFIGGRSIFLVAFLSLALSYPYVNYIRSMNKVELDQQMTAKSLFKRHEKELTVIWSIFFGVLLGFIVADFMIYDSTYQEAFIAGISGGAIQEGLSFFDILMNNLEVMGVTFLICCIVSSGLLFILIWNVSIMTYYIMSLKDVSTSFITGVLLLPHGLLETGGYILAGVAAALLAARLDRKKMFDINLDKQFAKDLLCLMFSSVCLIVLGAVVEVL